MFSQKNSVIKNKKEIVSIDKGKEPEASWLERLPPELLLHIYSYLDDTDILELSSTANYFTNFTNSTAVWKPLLLNEYNIDPLSEDPVFCRRYYLALQRSKRSILYIGACAFISKHYTNEELPDKVEIIKTTLQCLIKHPTVNPLHNTSIILPDIVKFTTKYFFEISEMFHIVLDLPSGHLNDYNIAMFYKLSRILSAENVWSQKNIEEYNELFINKLLFTDTESAQRKIECFFFILFIIPTLGGLTLNKFFLKKQPALITMGLDRIDGISFLHLAIKYNNFAVAEYLVSQGSDVNLALSAFIMAPGITAYWAAPSPLIIAVSHITTCSPKQLPKLKNIIELLLDMGANPLTRCENPILVQKSKYTSRDEYSSPYELFDRMKKDYHHPIQKSIGKLILEASWERAKKRNKEKQAEYRKTNTDYKSKKCTIM